VSGDTEIALHVYQALYGKAPGFEQLNTLKGQITASGAGAWANYMAANFSALSNEDFAAQVLKNISVTPTTLTATTTFGSAQQAYDGLLGGFKEYLGHVGPSYRGIVAAQLAKIISNLEVDTQFGVYGGAALALNKQVGANLAYSTNAANVNDSVVSVGPVIFCPRSTRVALGAEDPYLPNAWQLKNTGPSQIVSAGANNGLAGIDANIEAVHNAGSGCTGQGVVVAIVDSGLELGHEDFAANVLAGKSFNFFKLTDDTSPVAEEASLDHGTGVGGVAVARGWNGKGSRGTAPFASVVAYATVGTGEKPAATEFLSFGAKSKAGTSAVVTQFGNRADTVDIFNYSAGSDYADPPLFEDDEALQEQTNASKTGTETLRGGKGAIYLQAAGNEYTDLKGTRRDASQPVLEINCATTLSADIDQLGGFSNVGGMTCGSPNHEPANKPYFYQVASIHNTGKASSYSSAGSSIWITGFGGEYGVAEAAIITTDNSGCKAGANNTSNAQKSEIEGIVSYLSKVVADLFGNSTVDPDCNFTGRMNGTSAATPSVAGVVALMLEANPALTWRDVGFVLAKTARKVDVDIASGTRAVDYIASGATATLALDLPWQTNSAGFHFQNRYGFGLVDATAAVTLAQNFTAPAGRRTGNLVKVVSGDQVSTALGAGQYTRMERKVAFGEAGAVSGMMRVDLEITNTLPNGLNSGKLQFELVNNSTGQRSILMPAFTAWYVGGKTDLIAPNAIRKFRFHTNAFYGESLSGDYTVRVTNVGGELAFTSKLTSFSM
jgi:subtilisin family serine protease